MKRCCLCKIEKGFDNFCKDKSRKDGYNNKCKSCSNKRSQEYYKCNRDHELEGAKKRKCVNRLRNRKFIFDYYSNHPCVDCGECNPMLLEFDHLHDKDNNISIAVNWGWSLKRIKNEIDKCVVRCVNCHKLKTAKEQKWFEDLINVNFDPTLEMTGRRYVFHYRSTHPCIDCGEKDPIVLEFDHMHDKVINISDAVKFGWSIERIIEEIAKCVVRCGNCHRGKTAQEQGWYKDIIESIQNTIGDQN